MAALGDACGELAALREGFDSAGDPGSPQQLNGWLSELACNALAAGGMDFCPPAASWCRAGICLAANRRHSHHRQSPRYRSPPPPPNPHRSPSPPLPQLADADALSIINPLPKPGAQPGCCDGLRSFAVGTLAAKLFAMILERRLSNWAEASGSRAAGQFGFRHCRSTAQAALMLRTLQDQHRLPA